MCIRDRDKGLTQGLRDCSIHTRTLTGSRTPPNPENLGTAASRIKGSCPKAFRAVDPGRRNSDRTYSARDSSGNSPGGNPRPDKKSMPVRWPPPPAAGTARIVPTPAWIPRPSAFARRRDRKSPDGIAGPGRKTGPRHRAGRCYARRLSLIHI